MIILVVGALAFLRNGQPWWATLDAVATFPTFVRDSFNAEALVALWASFQQAAPTKQYLRRQDRERSSEAPVDAVLALAALLTTPPTLDQLAPRALAASSTMVLSMPAASRARLLLQQEDTAAGQAGEAAAQRLRRPGEGQGVRLPRTGFFGRHYL
jgi:hypothetical protein